MKKTLFALALGLASAMSAAAQDYTIGDVTITSPWARETTPMARASGGFMTITNTGDQDERLLSAFADFARAELHITVEEDGVNRMMEQEYGIVIPAGETVEFMPGSYHVMFMGLTGPFTKGEERTVTLTFQSAGEIDVPLTVKPFNARGAGHMNH
jgi:copper(I)-binding protein